MARSGKKRNKEDVLHYFKVALAVFALVFGVFLAVVSYRFGRLVFTDDAMTDTRSQMITYEITIRKGESTILVGWELQKAGVIRSAAAFFMQSKVYRCKIAPGTYTVYSKNSSKEIVKYLNQEYLKQKAAQ